MKSTTTNNKELKPINWWALGFAFLIAGVTAYYAFNGTTKPPTRQQKIEQAFNPFSGAHRELQKVIKSGLKDPESYEHISTGYKDFKSYLIITTQYRAKNSFNGFVVSSTRAKVSLTGKVILIY